MAAAGDTFINDMLNFCGLSNVLKSKLRYPALDATAIKSLAPEVVLLSSEPYPYSEKHIAELRNILPHTIVLLADGEYFSWYGSRLAGAPGYFNTLINKLNQHDRSETNYES